jgi:branched-chain amino acid transport system permease protein
VVGALCIVTLQNELADKVGSFVNVIMGAMFVVCVLSFRRGIVGELGGLYRSLVGRRD